MMTTDADGNQHSDNAEDAQTMFRQLQSQYSQDQPKPKKKETPEQKEKRELAQTEASLNSMNEMNTKVAKFLLGFLEFRTGGEIAAEILPANIKAPSLVKTKGYINLANEERTAHILAGDATGGGHAWFQSFKGFLNGVKGTKSMFPAGWSSEKIMHGVSEVTVNNNRVQQTGKLGALVTKSVQPVRYIVEGTYQGVKMRVVTTANEIITAFPIK